MRRRVYTQRAADAAKMSDLHAVAKAFSGFRPASEVFTRVRAVPTIFVEYDHGVRVGGHPTERISLVHGPSGEGKTLFTLGLVRSFLRLSFPADFIDAERTLEEGFIRLALGDLAGSPIFTGCRPDFYESTRTRVRKYCNTFGDLRAKGRTAPDAAGLVVVDSIRKLVPKDQWERLLELNKQAAKDEKARDRAAQHKAQMNAAWCDELIPLLEQTGCTMVIIARETEDPDADARSRMYGTAYKTGGGSALYYDASLDIRVDRARFVQKEKEGARPEVYGERHRITIKKSKVSGRGDDKSTVCYFHSSNGRLVPPGFDRARDVLELARRLGVVKGEGWLRWGKTKSRSWQGEHKAVVALARQPEALDELEAEVRRKFRRAEPVEVTADGEVLG